MKSFVPNLSLSIVSLLVAVAAAYAVLVPQDFALKGLGWVALGVAAIALSVAVVVRRSPRTMGQVLAGVDREPRPVPARASALQSRPKGTP